MDEPKQGDTSKPFDISKWEVWRAYQKVSRITRAQREWTRSPWRSSRKIACIANLTPVIRHDHRVGLPQPGRWVEILNTDSTEFGGSGVLVGDINAEAIGWNDLEYSATLTLPPLGVVWLAHEQGSLT